MSELLDIQASSGKLSSSDTDDCEHGIVKAPSAIFAVGALPFPPPEHQYIGYSDLLYIVVFGSTETNSSASPFLWQHFSGNEEELLSICFTDEYFA